MPEKMLKFVKVDQQTPNKRKVDNRLDDFKSFWSIKLEPIKLKSNGDYYEIVDGRHRLIAYKELDIMCPVYIGRKRVRYGYCWRDGVAYYDETIDMTVKNRNGYYAIVK